MRNFKSHSSEKSEKKGPFGILDIRSVAKDQTN